MTVNISIDLAKTRSAIDETRADIASIQLQVQASRDGGDSQVTQRLLYIEITLKALLGELQNHLAFLEGEQQAQAQAQKQIANTLGNA